VVVNARKSLDEARSVVKEIEKRGGKAMASLADVTDEEAVRTMVRASIDTLRAPGHRREQRRGARRDAHRADRLRDVEVGHRHHPRRRVPHHQGGAPRAAESGAGSIVNIGGMSGTRAPRAART
jgi:NADP-dependent 3-hydroxy acid dehydrogenase YdfG